MDQLQQYIVAQEHAGYGEEQIRQALAANGYAQTDIDAAFHGLKPTGADPIVHEYVQQYARQGYSAAQAFAQLRQQGYAPDKIRRAIKDVFGAAPSGGHAGTVAFLAIAILLVMGGLWLLKTPDAIPEQPGAGMVMLSPPEVIAQVLETARMEGSAAGVRQCRERLSGRDRDLCILDVAVTDAISDKTLCTQIADVEYHDACLMNFIVDDFEHACGNVKLAESKGTCEKIRALRQTGA